MLVDVCSPVAAGQSNEAEDPFDRVSAPGAARAAPGFGLAVRKEIAPARGTDVGPLSRAGAELMPMTAATSASPARPSGGRVRGALDVWAPPLAAWRSAYHHNRYSFYIFSTPRCNPPA